MTNNTVWSIFEEEESNLWIGTQSGGLNRFKNGKFTSVTTKDGLFNDGVYQILDDNKGNLWMSSSQGVFRVSKQQLADFAEGRIASITSVVYGTADAMKRD